MRAVGRASILAGPGEMTGPVAIGIAAGAGILAAATLGYGTLLVRTRHSVIPR